MVLRLHTREGVGSQMIRNRSDVRQYSNQAAYDCAERQRLASDFTSALRDLVDLQNDQIRAVIKHDPDFARFDILLHLAVQKKQETKYALMKHMEAHGCE